MHVIYVQKVKMSMMMEYGIVTVVTTMYVHNVWNDWFISFLLIIKLIS